MKESEFTYSDPKGVPHLFVEYGGWRVNPTHAADAQDLNRRAYNWATTRNLLNAARVRTNALRRFPVQQAPAYNPEGWQQPTGKELGYGPFN